MSLFRFDLTEARITSFIEGKSVLFKIEINDVEIKLFGYLFWEIIKPKNLPFWTKWKLKRSVLWEINRRREEEVKKQKENLIESLKH